jgi:glyoxylase I family protein
VKLSMHHVAVQVNNLEVARRFYVDLLGFRVTREQPHSVWLDAGGVIVMLELCSGVVEHGDWATPRVGPHVVAFSIAPADRSAWLQRLGDNNVVVDHESRFSIYFRDPFGARLALSHYPDE